MYFNFQFKRTSGPLNRRSPSRKSRGSSGDEQNESEEPAVPPKHNKTSDPADPMVEELPADNDQENEGDMNHNHPKPRVAFLELTNNREEIEKRGSPDMSPSRSPSSSRKPFIPPLDLSTLHEHVESTGIVDKIPDQVFLSTILSHCSTSFVVIMLISFKAENLNLKFNKVVCNSKILVLKLDFFLDFKKLFSLW